MEYNPNLEGRVDKTIDRDYEKQITAHVKGYLTIQQNLGISPPVFGMVSLLGVKGVHIGQHELHEGQLQPLIDSIPFVQDDLILPEVMFSNFENSKIKQQMRQIFDVVLNAAGLKPADA